MILNHSMKLINRLEEQETGKDKKQLFHVNTTQYNLFTKDITQPKLVQVYDPNAEHSQIKENVNITLGLKYDNGKKNESFSKWLNLFRDIKAKLITL